MSENNKSNDKVATIIGIVALVIIALFLFNMFNNAHKQDVARQESQNKEQQEKAERDGGSYDSALKLSQDDMSLSKDEFTKKYGGKWITFDGVLGNTAKNQTVIFFGDDANSDYAMLKNGTTFKMNTSYDSFDDKLQRFVGDYTLSGDELTNAPKVRVVAEVDKDGNGAGTELMLYDYSGSDGKRSIMSR